MAESAPPPPSPAALQPISTVIIALNEEQRLGRCVRSCLPFSDEVLVVDGGSTDGTQKVAAELGCRVIGNPWPGYAAQRNLGAAAAAHDWIFLIDSDEVADEELARAIAELRRGGMGDRRAYSLQRVNGFMGAWLTESPELKVRLYDRRRATIVPAPVHEGVDVPVGATETLPGRIWHLSKLDLSEANRALNHYTSLEADLAARERPTRTWRLLLRPLLRFGQRYVLQRAFRHGWKGLFLALHWGYWELLREMKVYEHHHPPSGRSHFD